MHGGIDLGIDGGIDRGINEIETERGTIPPKKWNSAIKNPG
jgi:hypothetical protein